MSEQQNLASEVPKGLQEAGSSFWAQVTSTYEMRPDEERILVQVCHLLDELETVNAALAAAPSLIVEGSTGQQVEHPLLRTVRDHRRVMGTLLRQLALADLDPGPEPLPELPAKDPQRQAAARARWDAVRARRLAEAAS